MCVCVSPTLGRVWEYPVASALDDGGLGGVLGGVLGGAAGLGGGVLAAVGGLFGGVLASLGRVGVSVVLPLGLLLQLEPARDVVQLGCVRQVDENLDTPTHTHTSTRQRPTQKYCVWLVSL